MVTTVSPAPHGPTAAVLQRKSRSYAARWKHEQLFKNGYLVVPSVFLQHYASLKPYSLSSGEVMLVLHLMEFKWDEDAPFPGYRKLGERMGISDKMARRHAQSLETKGFLRRVVRTGKTNRFDLTPLFDRLLELESARPRRARTRSEPQGEGDSGAERQ